MRARRRAATSLAASALVADVAGEARTRGYFRDARQRRLAPALALRRSDRAAVDRRRSARASGRSGGGGRAARVCGLSLAGASQLRPGRPANPVRPRAGPSSLRFSTPLDIDCAPRISSRGAPKTPVSMGSVSNFPHRSTSTHTSSANSVATISTAARPVASTRSLEWQAGSTRHPKRSRSTSCAAGCGVSRAMCCPWFTKRRTNRSRRRFTRPSLSIRSVDASPRSHPGACMVRLRSPAGVLWLLTCSTTRC